MNKKPNVYRKRNWQHFISTRMTDVTCFLIQEFFGGNFAEEVNFGISLFVINLLTPYLDYEHQISCRVFTKSLNFICECHKSVLQNPPSLDRF